VAGERAAAEERPSPGATRPVARLPQRAPDAARAAGRKLSKLAAEQLDPALAPELAAEQLDPALAPELAAEQLDPALAPELAADIARQRLVVAITWLVVVLVVVVVELEELRPALAERLLEQRQLVTALARLLVVLVVVERIVVARFVRRLARRRRNVGTIAWREQRRRWRWSPSLKPSVNSFRRWRMRRPHSTRGDCRSLR
jgi:hypothetical protein